jgi:hypothetical protein
MANKPKDYCTWFPENWMGKYIGHCCKGHDSNCSTKQFYNCLRIQLGIFWSGVITAGGAIGCWIKYTSKMIKRL